MLIPIYDSIYMYFYMTHPISQDRLDKFEKMRFQDEQWRSLSRSSFLINHSEEINIKSTLNLTY